MWVSRAVDQLWQDIRIAVRGLRKNPVFTLVAIGTLALGIGANTALFSIFNGLILRPLPVRDPGRLALLTHGSWSYPVWAEIKARENDLFDGAFAWSDQRFDLSRGGQSAFVDGAYVSGRFFEVLGVSAVRGRMLTPADDSAGAKDGAVAVISHRFWREHFAGADDVVGRQITAAAQGIHHHRRDAAGVLRRGRRADDGRDAALCRRATHSRSGKLAGRGRLVVAPDDGAAETRAEPRAGECRAPRRATADPRRDSEPVWWEHRAARYLTNPLTLVPATTGKSSLRTQFETPLFAMVVAVGLLLLVACTNIASLMVARVAGPAPRAQREDGAWRLALAARAAALHREPDSGDGWCGPRTGLRGLERRAPRPPVDHVGEQRIAGARARLAGARFHRGARLRVSDCRRRGARARTEERCRQ